MSDKKEDELYEAFVKARVAMWEAHQLWEEYLKLKMKTEYNAAKELVSSLGTHTTVVENKGPTCIECGKPYFSIPRMGIFHKCSKD
jgi:hypothetical protein